MGVIASSQLGDETEDEVDRGWWQDYKQFAAYFAPGSAAA